MIELVKTAGLTFLMGVSLPIGALLLMGLRESGDAGAEKVWVTLWQEGTIVPVLVVAVTLAVIATTLHALYLWWRHKRQYR